MNRIYTFVHWWKNSDTMLQVVLLYTVESSSPEPHKEKKQYLFVDGSDGAAKGPHDLWLFRESINVFFSLLFLTL